MLGGADGNGRSVILPSRRRPVANGITAADHRDGESGAHGGDSPDRPSRSQPRWEMAQLRNLVVGIEHKVVAHVVVGGGVFSAREISWVLGLRSEGKRVLIVRMRPGVVRSKGEGGSLPSEACLQAVVVGIAAGVLHLNAGKGRVGA